MGVIIIDGDGEEEVNTYRKGRDDKAKRTPDLRDEFDPRRIPVPGLQIVPVEPDKPSAPPPSPAIINKIITPLDRNKTPGKPVVH